MLRREYLPLVLLLLATSTSAEERFYPIMGPDGRIEMIRGEKRKAEAAEATAPSVAVPGAEGPSGVLPTAPVEGAAAAAAAAPAAPASAAGGAGGSTLPHAGYDSDDYVDSEAMDAATAPASSERKRFYLVNDGMGDVVSESAEGGLGTVVAPPRPPSGEAGGSWEPLESTGSLWSPQDFRTKMPWLPACFPAAERGTWPTLVTGESREVVVDAADLRFVGKERVHSGWRLEGRGPRTMVVLSYASSQRQPAFLIPRLAFLDGQGCVTRVVQGWFDRRYAANDRRHAYLRGELVVHTGEEGALLLLPPEQDTLAAPGPWQGSRRGQLKLTLKK